MNRKNKNTFMQMLPYIILVGVIICVLFLYGGTQTKIYELNTGELLNYLNSGEVSEMTITPKSSESVYYINGKLDSYKDNEYFTVKVIGEQMDVVTNYAETHDLDLYDTNKDPGSSNLLYIVVNILPIVIISFLAYYLFIKLAAGNNKSMDFGRSRAKLSEDGGKVRFSDVAGLKEEKEEVAELIDL